MGEAPRDQEEIERGILEEFSVCFGQIVDSAKEKPLKSRFEP